jgi:pyridoxal phosphate enzyme (YggS family)
VATRAAPGSIASRLAEVRDRIAAAATRAGRDPSEVTLVGVSKGHSAKAVVEAIDAGLEHLGENRVQEGAGKRREVEVLGRVATWHLVGHLQTNKVRAALESFAILHAVDSARLLQAISSRATAPVALMIEVNVSGEPTKFGIAPRELPALIDAARELPLVEARGLMTVAPRVGRPEEARPVFAQLRRLGAEHRLPWLSMGMTEDYEVAIEEGATHIRVGRAIFGERLL